MDQASDTPSVPGVGNAPGAAATAGAQSTSGMGSDGAGAVGAPANSPGGDTEIVVAQDPSAPTGEESRGNVDDGSAMAPIAGDAAALSEPDAGTAGSSSGDDTTDAGHRTPPDTGVTSEDAGVPLWTGDAGAALTVSEQRADDLADAGAKEQL